MEQRFCPNCGSTNVEPDQRKTNMLGEIIANPNKWVCNECNYTGLMPKGSPEEYAEDIEDLEFDETEQPDIDTDLGRGYLKYVMYVTLPITVIYLIILLL